MSNNHEDDVMQSSVFGLFAQSQETLDDAKRKSASESNVKTQYLQLSNDGTYAVRILPLAPVIGPDGQPILPMPRKGYEYPQRDIFLKINGVDKKGKKVTKTIPVCHTSLVFPKLDNDLIDLYVQLACDANEDDKDFCDKITGSTYNGGLKYNSKRCMYVFDMNDREKGLQILQLSYSQYKDLEDAKLRLWGKLAQKDANAPCPISSPLNAYPVEITRKTEKKKTSYSVGIDAFSGVDQLSQEELQMLLDAPRLPEVLYVYRRFHLEATVEFLRQQDEQFGLNIMESDEIKDCIDQIKMCLPADDQSHFSFGSDDAEGDESKGGKMTIDKLWAIYDDLEEKGLNDRSEEGQNLRSQIREFIEDNDLDIRVDRKKPNLSVLEEIQDALEDDGNDSESEDEAPASTTETASNETDDADLDNDDDNDDEDSGDESESPRRSRNDDTSEPAARPARRTTRPGRRR